MHHGDGLTEIAFGKGFQAKTLKLLFDISHSALFTDGGRRAALQLVGGHFGKIAAKGWIEFSLWQGRLAVSQSVVTQQYHDTKA